MLRYLLITLILPLIIKLTLQLSRKRCESKRRLDGRTCIVTGGNRGIGYFTAMNLAQRGARVILACRDLVRGSQTASLIRHETGNDAVYCLQLDLASLTSIRQFVSEFRHREKHLHILINNAGYVDRDNLRRVSIDDYEIAFQTNHLGPFLLTNMLLDVLRSSSPARIITLTSIYHFFAWRIDFDDLNFTRNYSSSNVYAATKIFNILFTKYLSKKLDGSGVNTYVVHPGVVDTDLAADFATSAQPFCWLGPFWMWLAGRNAEQGAQTTIYAAVDESLDHVSGEYLVDCRRSFCSPLACDMKNAEKLWRISMRMVNLPETNDERD